MKIDENKIKEYSGNSFNVTKTGGVSKIDFGNNKWIENQDYYAKVLMGDCESCTKVNVLYEGFTYDSILIVGLGLGLLPNYAKHIKNCSVVDVLEINNELISYVDYLDESISIIEVDAFNYEPTKKYDLILFDLWWLESEVNQEIQDDIKLKYINSLNANGRILIPLITKKISKD